MRGFKSFADKTKIDFDNGVTCIVGPNGSGKSNITDAVRWVLGEQRAKTLRGSKMEDIIFNGTNHRKKLGMAEVTLVFDNSERFFELDFNEVKVCRRVYRSGESEYLINDTNCRLRDVRDLFMDTGIGTDGYSIIGQGRIERVLSSNLDERRQLFEEAAGIVKYKTRKRETERKLNNTEQNLIRIEDIFNELAARVEPLRIESEKAKRHNELTAALSELELNLLITDLESVDRKIQKEDDQIAEFSKNLEESNASLKHLTEEKDALSVKIETTGEDLKSMENSFFEDKNYLTNLEGEMNVITARKESSLQELNRLKEAVLTQQGQLDFIKKEKEEVLIQKSSIEKDLNEDSQQTMALQQKFELESKAVFDAESQQVGLRQSIVDHINEVEKNKSEIASYEHILTNHKHRQNELNREIDETETLVSDAKSKAKDHDHQLVGLKKSEEDLNTKVYTLQTKLKSSREQIQNENIVLTDYRKKLTECTTESNLLKQMEKEHAGYDHSVKKTLQLIDRTPALGKGLNGVVASLMSIPKKYEIALEVALGKSIQNLVVDTPNDAKAIIAEVKRTKAGRVTFIPLSTIKEKGDQNNNLKALNQIKGYIGKANELFEYDKKYTVLYDYLVGRTVIVDTVETATEALKIKDLKYKVVTLEGDVFIPGGTITGGSYKSRSSGLLSRKRKIQELDDRTVTVTKDIEALSKKVQELKDLQVNDQYDLEQTSKILEGIRLELVKKENDLKVVQDDLNRLMTLISKRKSEAIIIDNDIQSVHDATSERHKRIEVLEKENATLENQLTDDDSKLEALKLKIQEMRETLTNLKIQQASKMEAHKNIESDLLRLNDQHDRLIADLDTYHKKMTESTKQTDEFNAEMQILEKKKQDVLDKSSSKHVVIEKMQTEIKGFEERIKTINADNKERFEYMESLKDTLHRFDIKRAKLDVHRDEIANRLFERYEMSPEDALSCKKDIDMSGANKEIKAIKKELKEIGDVNLLAIDEYEEVYERYHFLKEQHDDLVEARNTLRKLIRELEKEMKEKFIECFDVVKVHFADIFESLFVGGQATLSIADPDNILESDINIDVQPPGKKLQSIGLLSGGEKSLTAIALLFAILKTKPAPFCILDEIEAALDDVNVYRFADFLKEFTRNSQFVIITHRKGTMEIADNLFGVTMQEFGVSKMISVKLEDAILE